MRDKQDQFSTQLSQMEHAIIQVGNNSGPNEIKQYDEIIMNQQKVTERLVAELNDLHKQIEAGQHQQPQLQIQVMSDESEGDGGKGFVTITELRKYIMMAADEMSSTMKSYLDDQISEMTCEIEEVKMKSKGFESD